MIEEEEADERVKNKTDIVGGGREEAEKEDEGGVVVEEEEEGRMRTEHRDVVWCLWAYEMENKSFSLEFINWTIRNRHKNYFPTKCHIHNYNNYYYCVC